jgi:ubiquinone/menaquinone biosynthesis C-methylase UbiE
LYLPLIGFVFSGHLRAYSYLAKSIERFPCYDDFLALVKEAGFESYSVKPLSGGLVCLYEASKSSPS